MTVMDGEKNKGNPRFYCDAMMMMIIVFRER